MIRRLWIPTSRAQLLQAQHRLLQHHDLTHVFQRKRVKLDGSGLTINAIESVRRSSAGAAGQTTCVLAHGLGSGLGLFFPNLAFLAQKFDRVVAFDWMGFAASDRPEWDESASVQEATRFFTHSFSSLCENMGLDRFTFVAHSMGGLLAAEFALEKPEALDALILVSPAGLPPTPHPSDVVDSGDLPHGMRVFKTAWDYNLTPGSILRASGPRGPQYTRDLLARRFKSAHWNDEVLIQLIADYLYHATAQPGSGEYAMNSLMVPEFHRSLGAGIYARRPLLPRMFRSVADGGLPSSLPVRIIFGDNDWLYSKATQQALHASMQHADGSQERKNVSLQIAPKAGHHIYIDNPDAVHAAVDELFAMVHGDMN